MMAEFFQPTSRQKLAKIAVYDFDLQRRSSICWNLSRRNLHAEPYENLSEIEASQRALSLVLVNDSESGVAEVATLIRCSRILLPIVAYAERPPIKKIVRAIKNGADDYLSYPFDGNEFLQSVDQVLLEASKKYAMVKKRNEASASINRLSSREQEILIAISNGLTTKDMAKKFGISGRTVEIHRLHLRRKLGSISTGMAVRLLIESASSDTDIGIDWGGSNFDLSAKSA